MMSRQSSTTMSIFGQVLKRHLHPGAVSPRLQSYHIGLITFALESVLLAMSYSKSNNFELGLSLHLCLIAETVRTLEELVFEVLSSRGSINTPVSI